MVGLVTTPVRTARVFAEELEERSRRGGVHVAVRFQSEDGDNSRGISNTLIRKGHTPTHAWKIPVTT